MKRWKVKKKIVGIDYSLSCPAVCVLNSKGFQSSQFYYITTKKKYEGKSKNITGFLMKPWEDPIERFKLLSDFVLENLPDNSIIFIEGYSFGSKGRAIFQIAENGGILKYRLTGQEYHIIPPANVKKFATGKGNANKEKMYNQLIQDEGVDLKKQLGQETLDSPVTDIIDAYYIAKCGYESIKGTKTS
jgi:crossover junction endodeoxyribonuclease RuvC